MSNKKDSKIFFSAEIILSALELRGFKGKGWCRRASDKVLEAGEHLTEQHIRAVLVNKTKPLNDKFINTLLRGLNISESELSSSQPKPEVSDPGTAYHDEDPRLLEIQRLWGSICHQQRDALLAVAQGFAKQPPETSPENEEKVIDLYGKRSA